ncbi:hypothetical protein KAR91_50590 [Candidatus Pacearchaeota archaeon]|nr:hypothetical protein [Candidatus Pacearchaeota archaeon]
MTNWLRHDSQYGHIQRVTRLFDGKETTFRSKLEARWSIWCELRIEQGILTRAQYEVQPPITLEMPPHGNIKHYLPDFLVTYPDGHQEYEELKGKFTGGMATKMRAAAEQQDIPITIIFANLTNCKSGRAQFERAERLGKHIERVIFDADKTILKPISHLFDF